MNFMHKCVYVPDRTVVFIVSDVDNDLRINFLSVDITKDIIKYINGVKLNGIYDRVSSRNYYHIKYSSNASFTIVDYRSSWLDIILEKGKTL